MNECHYYIDFRQKNVDYQRDFLLKNENIFVNNFDQKGFCSVSIYDQCIEYLINEQDKQQLKKMWLILWVKPFNPLKIRENIQHFNMPPDTESYLLDNLKESNKDYKELNEISQLSQSTINVLRFFSFDFLYGPFLKSREVCDKYYCFRKILKNLNYWTILENNVFIIDSFYQESDKKKLIDLFTLYNNVGENDNELYLNAFFNILRRKVSHFNNNQNIIINNNDNLISTYQKLKIYQINQIMNSQRQYDIERRL